MYDTFDLVVLKVICWCQVLCLKYISFVCNDILWENIYTNNWVMRHCLIFEVHEPLLGQFSAFSVLWTVTMLRVSEYREHVLQALPSQESFCQLDYSPRLQIRHSYSRLSALQW